jgi:hypothetical protein
MNLDDSLRDKVMVNGAFEETAQMAQGIKFALRRGKNWELLPPESKEALEQIASSIAMLLTGDAYEPKHWHLIASYARVRDKALEAKSLESGVAQAARTRVNLFDPAPRAMRPAIEDTDAAS